MAGAAEPHRIPPPARAARIALAAGLAFTVIALAAVLAHAPATVAGANGIPAEASLAKIGAPATVCQAGETLPSGTTAIVISLSAFHGPRVTAAVLSGTDVVTQGQLGSNWSGRTVTIPVKPLTRTIGDATVCFAFSPAHEPVSPFGRPTATATGATVNGARLPGRMRAEYLKPGSRSWWSLAASLAFHLGLGRAAGGVWVAFLAVALMMAAAATTAAALLKELR